MAQVMPFYICQVAQGPTSCLEHILILGVVYKIYKNLGGPPLLKWLNCQASPNSEFLTATVKFHPILLQENNTQEHVNFSWSNIPKMFDLSPSHLFQYKPHKTHGLGFPASG